MRRAVIGIVLAVLALVSVALASMVVTYYVSVTPVVVKSPVEFESGADGVSTIDNVNKTRATIQAKIIPVAWWVSEDALRIHNVNGTQVQMRLRCLSVADPSMVIKAIKFYLVIDDTENLAVELGENGVVIQGESGWYVMALDAIYKVKVVTEGKSGIVEGTQAMVTLGLEVRSV